MPGGSTTVSRCSVRRIPIGAVGANFEARPNVAIDVAGQLLKSLNAAVLRTGGAALRTVTVLVDEVLRPALAEAGLPPAAVGLARSADREGARILVSLPHVAAARDPARQRRDDRGARAGGRGPRRADARPRRGRRCPLYRGGRRPREGARARSRRASTGSASATASISCSSTGDARRRCRDRARAARRSRFASRSGSATSGRTTPSTSPRSRCARSSRSTRRSRSRTARPRGLAAVDRHRGRGGGAAASSTSYRGTAAFWNATTRFTDGFALTGSPETGINVDRVPGPRGPVTYRDLYLRQYRVVGDGTQHR